MSSIRYIIEFEPQGPIAVTRTMSRGNFRQTQSFIPGRALRGALAATLSDAQPDLARLVYEGRLIIGDAREKPGQGFVLPMPASLKTCKRFPGFGDAADEHRAQDMLLETADTREYQCSRCRKENAFNPLETFTGNGFYRTADGSYHEISVMTGSQTHTAIDRVTGTVASGFLYEEEFIAKPSGAPWRWQAPVLLPSGKEQAVETALRGRYLSVGSSKSRGMGTCVVMGLKNADASPWGLPPLKNRLDALQKAADRGADTWLLPMLCASALVLPDVFGRYSGAPSVQTFASALDPERKLLGPSHLHLETAMSGLVRLGGWNTFPGVPATADLAVVEGSVFLWTVTGVSRDDLLPFLIRAEHDGIGLRRAEGCGDVIFAHPIHLEVKNHAS